MASKRDEQRAFKKLIEAFPGEAVSLDCQIDNFGGESMHSHYVAYRDGSKSQTAVTSKAKLSSSADGYRTKHITPMVAVNYLIDMDEANRIGEGHNEF
jgi:hypothetical protein